MEWKQDSCKWKLLRHFKVCIFLLELEFLGASRLEEAVAILSRHLGAYLLFLKQETSGYSEVSFRLLNFEKFDKEVTASEFYSLQRDSENPY